MRLRAFIEGIVGLDSRVESIEKGHLEWAESI